MLEGEEGPQQDCETKSTEKTISAMEMYPLPPPPKKQIPSVTLTDFVGHVPNLFKIDCFNLFDDNFRINVWTVHRTPDRLVPEYKIAHSYFVSLNEDNEIVDNTIHEVGTEELC